MKKMRLLGWSAVIALAAISCAKDADGDIHYQDEYIGTWSCNEVEGNLAPQFYDVEISAGTSIHSIVIEGLYNTPGLSVTAEIAALSIDIPSQTSAGITISGSGQANSDFDQITLNFIANDGSVNDTVEAKLTR